MFHRTFLSGSLTLLLALSLPIHVKAFPSEMEKFGKELREQETERRFGSQEREDALTAPQRSEKSLSIREDTSSNEEKNPIEELKISLEEDKESLEELKDFNNPEISCLLEQNKELSSLLKSVSSSEIGDAFSILEARVEKQKRETSKTQKRLIENDLLKQETPFLKNSSNSNVTIPSLRWCSNTLKKNEERITAFLNKQELQEEDILCLLEQNKDLLRILKAKSWKEYNSSEPIPVSEEEKKLLVFRTIKQIAETGRLLKQAIPQTEILQPKSLTWNSETDDIYSTKDKRKTEPKGLSSLEKLTNYIEELDRKISLNTKLRGENDPIVKGYLQKKQWAEQIKAQSDNRTSLDWENEQQWKEWRSWFLTTDFYNSFERKMSLLDDWTGWGQKNNLLPAPGSLEEKANTWKERREAAENHFNNLLDLSIFSTEEDWNKNKRIKDTDIYNQAVDNQQTLLLLYNFVHQNKELLSVKEFIKNSIENNQHLLDWSNNLDLNAIVPRETLLSKADDIRSLMTHINRLVDTYALKVFQWKANQEQELLESNTLSKARTDSEDLMTDSEFSSQENSPEVSAPLEIKTSTLENIKLLSYPPATSRKELMEQKDRALPFSNPIRLNEKDKLTTEY